MDKPSVTISIASFPSDNASDQEKATEKFGLEVGKAIEGEWFRRVGSGCRYYSRYEDFHKLRLYARGEQSREQYKPLMAHHGDLSHINLNWDIIKIAPKFVDIVVNGMQDRLFSIKAESQDILSAERKNSFQKVIEADMIAKDFLTQTKEQFGVDAFNVKPDELPENDEELSLYMQLKYKPSIEIAQETAINTIFEDNNYQKIKKQLDYDQTVLGVAVARHTFLPNDGLRIEYMDPANWIHSYCEEPDFSDRYYDGFVKNVHYTEVTKINPNITDEELEDIKGAGSAWMDFFPATKRFQEEAFSNEMVTLIYFNYKTISRSVYKKKFLKNGGVRHSQKDETFNPDATDSEGRFERFDIPRDVWYEGVLVAGSGKLLKWEMCKNMIRPKAPTQNALSPFVAYAPRMYKGVYESLVARMIPHLDSIQLTHLKIQQIKAKIIPDGVFIDADGINEVDLGTAASYTPEDALNLYFQTGSIIGRSFTTEGEFNHAKIPVQELTTNSGNNKLQMLIGTYNFELSMIRDTTGLNEARDGSNPDSRSLVGLQKLAALNSNTATRHILDAGHAITKGLAEGVSLRIGDIIQHADFAEEFAMQIGNNNIEILKDIMEFPLRSFGIFIEVAPDQEEKEMLEMNIQIALKNQSIELEDVIDIRNMKNIKMANELLKFRRKRKVAEAQKAEESRMNMQASVNQQSQEAAAQAKMEQIQAEMQIKTAVKQAEIEGEIRKMQIEAELKKALMAEEFNYNMQLRGIDQDLLAKREDKKESRKDDRTKIQASQQSELIEQRQKGTPPKNFESGIDNLSDDFDFSEFGPK